MPVIWQNGIKSLSLQKHSGGDISLLLFFRANFTGVTRKAKTEMIDKQALTEFIDSRLEGTDLYLVELKVSKDNNIVVEIDSDTSVDIDRCVELTRDIESAFSRDEEDYDLEVGSCGLTSPLKVARQYKKYIGNEVEVLSSDGKKYRGLLREAGDDSFTILSEEKVKKEGAKRPVVEQVAHTFPYSGVKYTKYLLQF